MFRRNPVWRWMLTGTVIGAAVGLVGGVIGVVVNLLDGGGPGVVSPVGFAVAGGLLGAFAALLWKSLGRPIWLALFWTKTFEREYGTPQEQGIVRRPEE